jgi:hypothetical protein
MAQNGVIMVGQQINKRYFQRKRKHMIIYKLFQDMKMIAAEQV